MQGERKGERNQSSEHLRYARVPVRHSSPTAFFVALPVSIMGRYSVGVLNIPVIDNQIIYCLVV
jgi:hypothetical protein